MKKPKTNKKPLTINNFRIKKLPKRNRDDVNKFYTFIAGTSSLYNSDNSLNNFKYLVRRWQSIKKDELFGNYSKLDESVNEVLISNMVYLVHRFDIDTRIIDDYLRSIAIVLREKELYNSNDFVRYLQYSAESPALMIAKILEFPNALNHHAKMQGRAIKLLQMILAIGSGSKQKDLFPKSELKKFNLKSLDRIDIENNPEGFKGFIELQNKRYKAWNDEAKKGDEFLPKKIRQNIKKIRIMNDFLVEQINNDPTRIFNIKYKPSIKIKLASKIKSR